jgi:hypothetical protein
MSQLVGDLRLAAEAVRSWIADSIQMARRATAAPTLVRLTAAAAALVSLGGALPTSMVFSRGVLLLAPLAIGVGLFPRTRWTSLVALLAVVAWLVTTLAGQNTVTLWRTVLLAGGLYLMHAAAALAAMLPYDAVVAPGLLVRWLIRVVLVLIASLGVAVSGMVVVGELQAVRTLAAPIIGSAIAAAIAGLLAWQIRRR